MPQPPKAPRILAVRFSSIGDIVLISPLLRALRTRHPECHLAVLTKEAFAPLLKHNPNVDRVYALSESRTLLQMAKDIRQEQFTHFLDLHGSLRSRSLRWLVPGRWGGYPKHRWARALLVSTKRNLYPKDTPPVAERYFSAAGDLDVVPDGLPADLYLDAEHHTWARAWLNRRDLGQTRPLAVAAPMAAHFTKRWPTSHWEALVATLTRNGIDVVVVGGPEDVAVCESVADSGCGRAGSAAGSTDLLGTGALIDQSQVVLSGDTGVMHMSTALNTPVVALFGPTVEAFGFFPYRAKTTILQQDLDCRPCSKMGGPVCPLGHHRCLTDIDPARVAMAVEELIGTRN